MSTAAPPKGFTGLIISIGLMVVLPTAGLLITVQLIWNSNPNFFDSLWTSKFELCSRLWLLASFFSTAIVTGSIVRSFIFSARYNKVRADKRFASYAQAMYFYVIGLLLLGLILLFIPHYLYAVWVMKIVALVTALWMWLFDWLILRILKSYDQADPNSITDADRKLIEELMGDFSDTIRLIDRPTAMAIAFVILLSYLYLKWILPTETMTFGSKSHNDTEVFILGLSCGAVAVELWFANFLFWLLFRDN